MPPPRRGIKAAPPKVPAAIASNAQQNIAAVTGMTASVSAVRMANTQANTLHTWVSILLLAAWFTALGAFALTRPLYTWDVVPYVATTFAAEADNPAALHGATYDLLRGSLDAAQFQALVGGEYPAAMRASPENFASQLNMYRIKPLYVLTLRGMAATGVNPVAGIIWLSLASSLVFCAILFLWLRQLTGPVRAALVVALFSIGARLPDLSRIPTPDTFSALALFAGLWLLLARKQTAWAVFCLVLSIWIRTNNILFTTPLLLLLCWNHLRRGLPPTQREFAWYGAGLLACAVSYFSISSVFDYAWWRLFHHTLIESQIDIDAFAVPFSWALYGEVLHGAALRLVANGEFIATTLPLFLLLWLLAWQRDWRGTLNNLAAPRKELGLAEISLLCLPVFAAFLLLFPLIVGLDRFLAPYYALITVFVVSRFAAPDHRRSQ